MIGLIIEKRICRWHTVADGHSTPDNPLREGKALEPAEAARLIGWTVEELLAFQDSELENCSMLEIIEIHKHEHPRPAGEHDEPYRGRTHCDLGSRTDGPWLVIVEIDGGYACRSTEELSDVEEWEETAREASNAQATVIVIPMLVVVAALDLLEATKGMLQWLTGIKQAGILCANQDNNPGVARNGQAILNALANTRPHATPDLFYSAQAAISKAVPQDG